MKKIERVIMIGGVPASGKTTITSMMLGAIGDQEPDQWGTRHGHVVRFGGARGTDMWMRSAEAMTIRALSTARARVVVIEGLRTWLGTVLEAARWAATDVKTVVCMANTEVLQSRWAERRYDAATVFWARTQGSKVSRIRADAELPRQHDLVMDWLQMNAA